MIKNTFNIIQDLVGGGMSGGSDGTNIIYHDGQTPPTKTEIKAETERQEEEYATQEYARNRASAYDSIGNQLDLLFHDMTAGKGTKTGEWYKAVAKVKADNPKG